MSRVVVLDYGTSNLRSVAKALEIVAEGKHHITVSADPDTILQADKVVFPGQGAIGQCMTSLEEQGLDEVILECINHKPFMGICLGLQSLMKFSEEDNGTKGLGIIPGQVLRFEDNVRDEQGFICKIPHMGWNQVYQHTLHPLWKNIDDGTRFYFVHSYYVRPDSTDDIVGKTRYVCEYTSAVARENLFATQFHPEKSQHPGLILLKNFINWKI